MNASGLALVKHFEGLYLTAYRDPVGVLTIGYGHTGPDVTQGLTISQDEAERLLLADLATHEQFVRSVVTVGGTEDEIAALTSFAFNVGNGALRSSTLLRKYNEGRREEAGHEFTRWVYGTINGQKVQLPGLVRRRGAERLLFLNGTLQFDITRMQVTTEEPEHAPVAAAPVSTDVASGDEAFSAFIQSQGLKYFKPYEFLVLGHQNQNADSPAYNLNRKPSPDLWENIVPTAKVLDRLRELMGAPIATLSAYRTPEYNAAIGGARSSQHMTFRAVDFIVKSNSGPADWASALRQLRSEGLFKGGIGTYSGFVHLDTRGENVDF